jgi:hypothetical protein
MAAGLYVDDEAVRELLRFALLVVWRYHHLS